MTKEQALERIKELKEFIKNKTKPIELVSVIGDVFIGFDFDITEYVCFELVSPEKDNNWQYDLIKATYMDHPDISDFFWGHWNSGKTCEEL